MSLKSEISHHQSGSEREVLVRVENVGKIFCRDLKKSLFYGLKDSVKDLLGGSRSKSSATERTLRKGEFWANKGVSFELRRGECLGLIGHNGAGKTTLLKMLNGLIKPDTGRIEMRGRIGALIALGAGFNPILTGRENIYINGSVLGVTKEEIGEKIDEIIDFAEIREFIDSPVQTYSSGMQVRLGFSIAAFMNPDILLVDEVLAVGDMRFRRKCQGFIKRLQDKGTAIILVSHGMAQVMALCENAVVMDHGCVVYHGSSEEAVSFTGRLQEQSLDGKPEQTSNARDENAPITIEKISVDCVPPSSPGELAKLVAKIHYQAKEQVKNATASFQIYRDGIESPLTSARSLASPSGIFDITKGTGVISASFERCPLIHGEYLMKAGIGTQGSPTALDILGYDDSPFRFTVPDLTSASPWSSLDGEILHWQGNWKHQTEPSSVASE